MKIPDLPEIEIGVCGGWLKIEGSLEGPPKCLEARDAIDPLDYF